MLFRKFIDRTIDLCYRISNRQYLVIFSRGYMTNKKIITISLSLTIIHFILTSLIGHYISVQIGTEMGKIISDGLIESSDVNRDKANEEATRISQNMESKRDKFNKNWKTPQLIISFPVRPLITSILKDIRKQQVNKVIAKEMTREQFRTQGLVIDYAINLLNSLLLGLLIYIGLRFIYRKQMVR